MMHVSKLAGAAIAAAALAIPAAASAHPSVYVSSAPVLSTAAPAPLCSATGATGSYTANAFLLTCAPQTRYVFTNHGNTVLLRESNGKTTGGAISYAHRPAGLAAASDYDVLANPPQGPATGAQVHATCDVPALTTPTVIRSWQGTDPFYAYVPFQRTAAGYDDKPGTWLAIVKSATGIDLEVVADTEAAREAACEALPGATAGSYVPADATQSTKEAWALGPVEAAVKPLEEHVATLTSDLAAKTTELAGVKGALSNATTEIASLKAALTRLKLTFPATAPSLDALAANGLALRLAGPASQTANVRLLVPADKLKKLGLKSRIVGTRTVVLGADGTASFTLKPTATAAAALKRYTGQALGAGRGHDR